MNTPKHRHFFAMFWCQLFHQAHWQLIGDPRQRRALDFCDAYCPRCQRLLPGAFYLGKRRQSQQQQRRWVNDQTDYDDPCEQHSDTNTATDPEPTSVVSKQEK